MELKYVILLLTALCVVFIIVEELFQSRSFSSNWRSPKSRLVANTPLKDIESHENIVKQTETEEETDGIRLKGGWVDEDDVDHISNEEEDTVWSMKRWKDWTAKVHGKPSTNPQKLMPETSSRKPRKKNMKKVWDADDDYADENEKLRNSPYIFREDEEYRRLSAPVIEKEIKYITHFLPWELAENKKKTFKSCRYKKCAFIDDMTQADLVAFKAGNIRDREILTFERPPGQRWLMYTIDPAIRGYELGREKIKSLFNATMTYNLDADIAQLFGRLRKVSPPTDKDYDRVFDEKTKQAAWFVSHCVTPSLREQYVKRMQGSIDIDIYGDCGNLSCGGGIHSRHEDSKVCLPLLSKHYKFYLAFENAFCLDYVTEKFFKLFQDVSIIPVVRGGFQYKKYLPAGIFVNADDFKSPEELSEYLIQLGNDKKRYIEMLKRKDEWQLVNPESRQCLLCEYLHSNPPPKFYKNLKRKFGRDSCWFLNTL